MEICISCPPLEEFHALSILIWKSFYYAEKNNVSMEGMEHFRDLVDVCVLQYEFLTRHTHFLCAYQNGEPIGVVGVRENHIVLLFVSSAYQKMGVGSRLLYEALKDGKHSLVTVNSGLSAKAFYQKLGFRESGEMRNENGLLSQPMNTELESLIKRLAR